MNWADIAGYEGMYQVFDTGIVRSLDRIDARGWRRKGRVLKACPNSDGYLTVMIGFGKRISAMVHTLVLTAFRGPRPHGLMCCHGDDVKTNNHIGNLRWGTRMENKADSIRNGTAVFYRGPRVKGRFQCALQ